MISGIVYMLQSSGRWRDCPAEYGPYTTVYNRFNRWSRQGVWHDFFQALTGYSGTCSSAAVDSSSVKAHRSAAGAKGGLLPEHRPLQRRADDQDPRTGRRSRQATRVVAQRRQTNDITMAHALIEAGPFRKLLADRGYDADHVRKRLAERNVEAVIQATTSRKSPIPYDVVAYRQRNAVERLWARLKDYRRVAIRYDKLATNYLSGVLIAATIRYWAK